MTEEVPEGDVAEWMRDLISNGWLNLSGFRFVRFVANDVKRLFQMDKTITSCSFSGCSLDDNWLSEMWTTLANEKLRSINLSYNNFSDSGMEFLGHVLSVSECLTELYLNECTIGSQGLIYLARGIARSTSLKKICIQGRGVDVDYEAGQALGDAILAHKTLHHVDLYDANVSVSAAQYLLKVYYQREHRLTYMSGVSVNRRENER